jgi:hypothetical protein
MQILNKMHASRRARPQPEEVKAPVVLRAKGSINKRYFPNQGGTLQSYEIKYPMVVEGDVPFQINFGHLEG